MNDFVFSPAEQPRVSVVGGGFFPVRRIICIGKNYAAHIAEMGGDAKKEQPVFFCKPADAVTEQAKVPYPPGTNDLHFEGELVVAIGGVAKSLDTNAAANDVIFGYAAGCDLTRRDLQSAAKSTRGPWDIAKAFDHSAPIAPIVRRSDLPQGRLEAASLKTTINGECRQDASLGDMIWSVPEIIMTLSTLLELHPGDLIFTGTPEGVGAIVAGDDVVVQIGELPLLAFKIGS